MSRQNRKAFKVFSLMEKEIQMNGEPREQNNLKKILFYVWTGRFLAHSRSHFGS